MGPEAFDFQAPAMACHQNAQNSRYPLFDAKSQIPFEHGAEENKGSVVKAIRGQDTQGRDKCQPLPGLSPPELQ